MSTLAILSILAFYTPDIPFETTYRIAYCESRLDPNAKNPNSSATGLFQFTKGTWDNYCHGDIFSVADQAKCFNKLYPKHKNWWECK